jgi:hypothetical protein
MYFHYLKFLTVIFLVIFNHLKKGLAVNNVSLIDSFQLVSQPSIYFLPLPVERVVLQPPLPRLALTPRPEPSFFGVPFFAIILLKINLRAESQPVLCPALPYPTPPQVFT